MLRQDDFNYSHLVLTGWRHGCVYGGHLASCAIMCVLANRQKLGWGTFMEVIYNVPKYSAKLEQPTGIPQVWSPEFVRLLHEVQACADGSKDFSKGALYWADLAEEITNPFFKEKILGDPVAHPMVMNMNSLSFFR